MVPIPNIEGLKHLSFAHNQPLLTKRSEASRTGQAIRGIWNLTLVSTRIATMSILVAHMCVQAQVSFTTRRGVTGFLHDKHDRKAYCWWSPSWILYPQCKKTLRSISHCKLLQLCSIWSKIFASTVSVHRVSWKATHGAQFIPDNPSQSLQYKSWIFDISPGTICFMYLNVLATLPTCPCRAGTHVVRFEAPGFSPSIQGQCGTKYNEPNRIY